MAGLLPRRDRQHFGDGTGLEQAPYTFASRFEGGDGASREALLAAAHAACLNHAVANFSEVGGMAIATIETTVELTTGRDDLGPAIVGRMCRSWRPAQPAATSSSSKSPGVPWQTVPLARR